MLKPYCIACCSRRNPSGANPTGPRPFSFPDHTRYSSVHQTLTDTLYPRCHSSSCDENCRCARIGPLHGPCSSKCITRRIQLRSSLYPKLYIGAINAEETQTGMPSALPRDRNADQILQEHAITRALFIRSKCGLIHL